MVEWLGPVALIGDALHMCYIQRRGFFFQFCLLHLPPTNRNAKAKCLNLLYEILLAAFPLVASYVGRLVK